MPHGNCSSCKHWLIEGDVDDSAASVYAIPRDEREDGAILLCCTFARTDLVIEIDQHDGIEELPPMEPPAPRQATVLGVRLLTPALVELHVEVQETVRFRAGQYAEITVGGTGERRSYSLVNPPGSGRELVFCIKRIPGGVFDAALDGFGPGTRLDLEVPFGTMFLRHTGRPVLAAAIGSGIAPILSILTDAASREVDVPIRFYYGARSAEDLVYLDEIGHLSERLPRFTFIPCLSRGHAMKSRADGRGGSRGPSRKTSRTRPRSTPICAAPRRCATPFGRLLEAKGLPEAHIHADKFYPAVEPVSVRV